MTSQLLRLALCLTIVLCACAAEADDLTIDPGSIGAIAFSPSTGKFAYSYNYRSRKTAEQSALKRLGQADGIIACWANHGFCSLALGNEKACWGAGWIHDNGSNRDAEDMARKNAEKFCGGVYIAITLSSDGQRIWDHRDHMTIIDKDGNISDGYGNPIAPTATPTPASPASSPPSGK